MVKCELDDDGQPYSHYNLDGTADKSQIAKEALEAKKSLHKANWLKKKKQAEHDEYLVDEHDEPIPS